MLQPRRASSTASANSALAPVDVGRVEHPRRQLALVERAPHQFQAARAVAEVQVHDAGLAGHQPGDVAVGGEPQQLVERGLAASGGR